MAAVDKKAMLGHKVRRFRQDLGMTQIEMAETLEISASYLNLIEHNQRPVTVPLLFRLGQAFEVDLREFAEDESARLAAGLKEVFSDPLFEGQSVREQEIRELAEISPAAASAVMNLYKAYVDMRTDTQALAQRLADPEKLQGLEPQGFPVEEVRDFYQDRSNYFPELEALADALWEDAELSSENLFQGLTGYLQTVHQTGTRVMPMDLMGDSLRRFDFHRHRVLLSEALPHSGRVFQLGVQLAHLAFHEQIQRIVDGAGLSSPDAERLCYMGLTGYFAGAVMMPYDRFLAAAKDLRYDIEMLQNRFGAGFEQVCHRFTTLQRPGARGISFFFIRVDNAGNVSKRLSGAGFQFARFGGTCPRWVVHDVFQRPGVIHSQLAAMPDGTSFLTIARTVEPVATGHLMRRPQLAVAVGCDAADAKHLVYGEGLDPKKTDLMEPVGVSCRVCDRADCSQRAHPPLNHRLKLDPNMRRLTPFAIAPN